jgi:hypothetical protein
MAWYDEEDDSYYENDAESFDPEDFDDDEIGDIDQLYEYDDDYFDMEVVEFHGTGDTGGEV